MARPELFEYIENMLRQGYKHSTIKDLLIKNGWDRKTVLTALKSTRPKRLSYKYSKKITVIALGSVIIVLAIAFLLIKHFNSNDITVDNLTSKRYVVSNSISAQLPDHWTKSGDPNRINDTFNYDRGAFTKEMSMYNTELNSDNFDSVKDRKIKIYPYSLDKLFEIQVINFPYSEPTTLQSTKSDLADPDYHIYNLKFYKVNNREVADYIAKGENGLRDQRIIRINSPSNTSKVEIVINSNDGNQKPTQENFDGLMQLVASVKFD